jgi:hypothetical protein
MTSIGHVQLLGLCLFDALLGVLVLWQFAGALRRMKWRSRPSGRLTRDIKLSVIVPARNEEQDIAVALDSIVQEKNVDLEVIVVNDHSHDQTGAIADGFAATDGRVTVLHDPELRPGWLGKVNAMQQAAARATGNILLFTDADVRHAPDCFSTALMELQARGLDFFSLFPKIQCVSFWENVNVPLYVGGLAQLAAASIEDERSPDAVGAGAFLLVRAEVFRAAGGFEPLRTEMFDDVALARLIKQRGYRVAFRAAPDLLCVRLFKGNGDAFFGMTKNILAGLNGRLWLAPVVVLLAAFVVWTPILAVVIGAAAGETALLLAGLATYALQYGTMLRGRDVLDFHRGKALFFPLVALVVACCMARAPYYRFVRGSVLWRGRAVRVCDAPQV